MKKFIITNKNIESELNLDKLKIISEYDNKNIFKKNKEFICQFGTFFYKENSTQEALEKLLDEFDENNPRKNLDGNYFLFLKKNNNYYFFSDENSVYKVYYQFTNGEIIIGNVIFDIALLNKKINVDINNLIENSFQYSILNEESYFKDIFLVKKKEILKIDASFLKLKIVKIKNQEKLVQISSFNQAVDLLLKNLKKQATLVKNNYNKIAINMTGGLDSRLVLATYLSVGVKPILLYGKGNNLITNTFDNDYNIVKKIAKKYNLEIKDMDWSSQEKFDSFWNKLIEELGEYAHVYSGNLNILNSYKKLIVDGIDYFEFGYFGELYRNIEWLDENKSLDIIDEKTLFNKICYRDYKKILHNSEVFIEHFKKKIKMNINEITGNKNFLKRDEFIKFNLQYRLSADTIMTCYINLISNTSLLLGSKDLLEILKQIPSKFKNKSELMIELINRLEPELLEVPIFSHCENKKYNLNTNQIEDEKNKFRKKTRKIIRKIKYAKNKIQLKRDVKNEIVKIEKDLNIKIIKEIDGDIRGYIYILFNLYLLKKLKENKVEIEF